jgi:hypothetical protein
MNKNGMVKREERTSLNVSVETRELVLDLLYEIQAEKRQRCTQDDVVRFLVAFYRERSRKK